MKINGVFNIQLPQLSKSANAKPHNKGRIQKAPLDIFVKNKAAHEAKPNASKAKQAVFETTRGKKFPIKKLAPFMLAATAFVAGVNLDKDKAIDANSILYDNNTHTMEETANFTGIDVRALMAANGINSEDETLEKVILPSEYSPLENEISEITEKLADEDLKDSKREELLAKLESLMVKKNAQDALAYVYLDPKDNKKVFIIPKEQGISLNEIKIAFGIKDEVIRKNNSNIEYDWKTDDPEYGYYKDYTESAIPYEGITIPIKELYDGD